MSIGLLASTGNTFLTCVLEDVRQNNDVFPQGKWEALPYSVLVSTIKLSQGFMILCDIELTCVKLPFFKM